MKTIRLLLLTLSAAASAAGAADYCSLVVRVVDPNGRRPTAEVTVTEQGGRKLTQIEEGNDAKFCDLGLRPVTVDVGDVGTCNQVRISDVPLTWNATYHLKITYDPVPCLKEPPHILPRYCTFLFRVEDDRGKWVPGAAVAVMPSGLTLKTDIAGRASFDPDLGSFSVTISASGYSGRSFERTCTPEKSREPQEEIVKLAPK